MRINARVDYACKALLELSLHWPNVTPLRLSVIAERQKVPIKFLNQIFINLRQFGYVQSSRGKNGGYVLAKAPKDIGLGDVVASFSSEEIETCESVSDIMANIWNEVNKTVQDKMLEINFETIADRKHSLDKRIMFEI